MPDDALLAELSQTAAGPVAVAKPLHTETTFQIGGPARYFCQPDTAEAVRAVLLAAKRLGVPYFILGGGSNVLFKDEGFPGLVISLRRLNHVLLNPTGAIRVGAGLLNSALTEETLRHHLTGFEWASGLPGTVGGAVFMNAKCYGHAFGEIVGSVKALNPADGAWLTLSQADCLFAYKDSVFQHQDTVITEVQLELTAGNAGEIEKQTAAVLADRQAKGQFDFPSAGCVFRNNYQVGIPSGRLIEDSGLKGRQAGAVKVYERHANFIVNLGGGKAADVLALMALIKQKVWEDRQVRLEEELRVAG
jgi:UDP-N-acetylmuramate dehydrogenase